MILFELKCAADHRFEVWFRDGRNFESQRKSGRIVCPDCGSRKVDKAPMAPRIGRKANARVPRKPETLPQPTEMPTQMAVMTALRELRSQIEANCDYVGPEFAEEARRIHHGETEARGIYGETTEDEAQALDDEGIEIARVPWVPRHDS